MQVILQVVSFSLKTDGCRRPVLTTGKRPISDELPKTGYPVYFPESPCAVFDTADSSLGFTWFSSLINNQIRLSFDGGQ